MRKAWLLVAGVGFAAAAMGAEPVIHPRHNDLMTAVIYRDPAAVQELIEIGKWPDKADSRGYTPLAVAIELGDRQSAELLLKAGADPDKRALDGTTPRSTARRKGDAGLLALLEQAASAGNSAPRP